MSVDPGPFDLTETRLVMGPHGDATPKAISPAFYAELDAEFDHFAGHVLLSEHAFEEHWSSWEMHPKGDEIVYLIEGDVDFVLWTGTDERTLRVDRPGTYIVVPKGTWHTARPRRPTRMPSLTPGEGTRHGDHPGR